MDHPTLAGQERRREFVVRVVVVVVPLLVVVGGGEGSAIGEFGLSVGATVGESVMGATVGERMMGEGGAVGTTRSVVVCNETIVPPVATTTV
mmetsp:Transcript_35623/g.36114  ORF Transcript_35623/g.36114 Transcript_35623/m.36114 type:complete len:92 (-) Transcript_35623:213-488(-)